VVLTACVPGHGDLSRYRPFRQRARPADVQRLAHLRQFDPTITVGKTVRTVGGRVFRLAFPLEPRVPGLLAPERIECALQMSQRRLERTFRRLGEPRRLRVAFPGSEHLVGLCVGYPAMLLRPGAGTLSQRSVVDVTDAPERASK